MKPRELEKLGVPRHAMKAAQASLAAAAAGGLRGPAMRERIRQVVSDPAGHTDDSSFGELARALAAVRSSPAFTERTLPAPYRRWGADLEEESVRQMERACRLPVSVAGALMPDAHVGYGLPIGGVLATENAVVPYAVGVDIACRMRLSVLDLPASLLETEEGRERLGAAIERQTRFGVGATFKLRREHEVLDGDWSVSPITQKSSDRAWSQLGTSGSGNHFVEFGTLTLERTDLGLEPGVYLALLSHSGSRGTGAAVCDHYSRMAIDLHPELPKDLKYLAWLDLGSQPGQEYWAAMNLMGEYAAANHAVIHREVLRDLGASAVSAIENHHNFAWKERHDPGDGSGERELIVHRKGATPAAARVLGVIPGSMASPGFVVRGRGSALSLNSASHGAGRVMSRTKARESFAWGNVKRELALKGVTLLSAGLDEVPGVYKDIHKVMAEQADLVDMVARFDPRLVKMSPDGERAED
jgi:tRNA-splicing ligase RtcB